MMIAQIASFWLYMAAGVVVAVISVWALVDCLRRPAANFPAMGKLSKPAWMGITGVAAIVSVVGVIFMSPSSIFMIAAAVGAGVYLADVKPAVSGKGSSWY
ncbi:DUF2516 family protein [Galactobacter valiniphilus]|uniref:DUF2516 family protein n=1 Tax=Galactobacter valiniphilus TaxID=2676122 RepID=UPI0037358E54